MREPDRIIRLKTVLARTGLSRSTSTARLPRARSRHSSKLASMEAAGMNPTSTAGLQIPSRGVRKVRFDEVR